MAEWYHTWLWTLVWCAVPWAVGLSLGDNKLFIGPKQNIYAFSWFYLVYLIWYYYLSSCELIVKQNIENKQKYYLKRKAKWEKLSSLTIKKPNYEVHGGARQHGPVGVQVLRSDGRHHGVDDKPPSPSVHGSVRVELPLDLVTGDPDFRGPVAPVTSGPDADDPSCAVHDGQRIVPTFSRTLPVKFDSERLRARNPDMTGLASVIWIMNKFNSYSLKHKWDYTHYIKFK